MGTAKGGSLNLREGTIIKRCGWGDGDALLTAYHDREWGVPQHDEDKLFEFLVLEGAQAGLSWVTILRKREHYRRVFEGFDPRLVARFGRQKIQDLLADPGIIRNRLKIEAAIKNARAVLDIREKHGSLAAFLWRYVEGEPKQNAWQTLDQIPSQSPESMAMSKDLKKMGCSFVGPTICYAFMQAVGMVNDHLTECFRYGELSSQV
jgi:DNA-3-methyladenine glycosylase I